MARILIIDDEPDIRSMLLQMLKLAGHEPVAVADGMAGLLQCLAKPADLIITDLYMPTLDGLEIITDLRRRFPGLPIIAMSGKPAAEIMLSVAQKLGAVQVFEKPFALEDLLAAVERALPQEKP